MSKKSKYTKQHNRDRHIDAVKRLCARGNDDLDIYVQEDGKRIKACPDCLRLKQTTKKCLSCEHPFTPTCRIRFLCQICYERNIKDYHVNYAARKY